MTIVVSSLSEMVDCFNEISGDPDCRVVVVSGAGKVFTAGTTSLVSKFHIVVWI